MKISRFRIFEKAVDATVLKGLADSDLTEAQRAIGHLASNIDSVAHRLAETSDKVSARFAEYAKDVHCGGWAMSHPTNDSAIREVAETAVKLDAMRDQILTLVFVTCGKDVLDAFRDAVAAEYRKVPA